MIAVAGLLAAGCSSGGSESSPKGGAGTSGDGTTTTRAKPDDSLKLNQIQVIGTHNSFHVAATGKEHQLLVDLNAEQAAQRTYSHPKLTEQLDTEKIRQIELDIFADAKGGLYASPSLRRQAGLPDYLDEVPAMAKPGTKVLHEQDVDYHSICPVFTDCLKEVKTWSDANPSHVPLAIDIQFKDGPLIFAVPDQAKPEHWTTEAMDGLDDEIRSVFADDEIITPDDVRGSHATLEESVLAGDWPTLGESRGKVMFQILNGEPYRSIYLGGGHEGLKGRVMFTNAQPGQPDASYVSVDDAVADAGRIADLVRKGYLVRTRADEPGKQGETGDTTVRDAALASGAQWISTDYPGPDGAKPSTGTEYLAEMPDFLAARCNPVTAPTSCQDAAVEP
ncbi:MAG: putative secreted protein [Acidimicrobiales bacterium]|nr:putative secreted protein [Acidimicrobiales bacterium]